jgi:hypothetical protein
MQAWDAADIGAFARAPDTSVDRPGHVFDSLQERRQRAFFSKWGA